MFSPVAGQSVWETLTASVLTLPARRLGWALVGQGVSDLRGYKISRTIDPMTTLNPLVSISVYENVTNYITKDLSMDVEIENASPAPHYHKGYLILARLLNDPTE